MYNNSSIENDWADLADSFFVVCVIVRTRFLQKKIWGKSTGKVGNLDVENTTLINNNNNN